MSDDDWEEIDSEGGTGDGEDRHLVCMPCYGLVPLNTGLLTIHDVPEDRELRDVWCPCGVATSWNPLTTCLRTKKRQTTLKLLTNYPDSSA